MIGRFTEAAAEGSARPRAVPPRQLDLGPEIEPLSVVAAIARVVDAFTGETQQDVVVEEARLPSSLDPRRRLEDVAVGVDEVLIPGAAGEQQPVLEDALEGHPRPLEAPRPQRHVDARIEREDVDLAQIFRKLWLVHVGVAGRRQ